MNLCEIGLFHIVGGVSKAARDNYHGFGENNVLWPKYIDIYKFRGWQGSVHGPPYIFLFIIKKNGKSTRAWPMLKSNSTSYWLTCF